MGRLDALLSCSVKAPIPVAGSLLMVITSLAACAPSPDVSTSSFISCVADIGGESVAAADGGMQETSDRPLMHQLRNMEAMVELVAALPLAERPRTIIYLASGDHLAPLALCELAPPEATCRLVLTEVEPAVQDGIQAGLVELDRRSCLDLVDAGSPIREPRGRRTWTVMLAGRRASVELRVAEPGRQTASLVSPELLWEADLVISHDWSGEPIGNLQVVYQFVDAARQREEVPPLLMIEDLEAHLFPVDLGPFGRKLSTSRHYGHRGSDEGPGRHGRIELGDPLFGGAVILDFSDPWWRAVDDDTLAGFFDFLLLNEFDVDRCNVLVGGEDPLVAPIVLDWWTGYGARGIDGTRFEKGSDVRARAIEAAIAVAEIAEPGLRERVACRLRLYSCLLGIRAAGEDTLDLMPSHVSRPDRDALLSSDMDRLYRQALRNAGEFRAEREAFEATAGGLLSLLGSGSTAALLLHCPAAAVDGDGGDPTSGFRSVYRSLGRWLNHDASAAEPQSRTHPLAARE